MVDAVLVGVLRRRAVGGLDDGDAVPLVAPRRHPQAADLGGEGVGEVVAVEVRRGDDVVLSGAQEYLLEHRVGDAVVDDDLAVGGARPLGDGPIAEALARLEIPPVLEGPLGVLHDVALVHQGDGLAAAGERVGDSPPHEPTRAGLRDRLDADAAVGPHGPAEAG